MHCFWKRQLTYLLFVTNILSSERYEEQSLRLKAKLIYLGLPTIGIMTHTGFSHRNC